MLDSGEKCLKTAVMPATTREVSKKQELVLHDARATHTESQYTGTNIERAQSRCVVVFRVIAFCVSRISDEITARKVWLKAHPADVSHTASGKTSSPLATCNNKWLSQYESTRSQLSQLSFDGNH